jgi:hypothetical protein
MKKILVREEYAAIIFHIAFSILSVVMLLVPGLEIGIKLFILVPAYNIALPLTAARCGYHDWLDIWIFAIVLSLFQVFPDWFLSLQLGVLVFPEDGFVKIGTVSGYMAGLWAIPMFAVIYTAERIAVRASARFAYGAAVILALGIFWVSEETMWMLPSWYAQNVAMIGHTALYIIIPEMILGISSLYAYRQTREKKCWFKVPAAFLVMLLYLGSAAFLYFAVERLVR